MKNIETYTLFDPNNMTKGWPVDKAGNYIVLLRPGVMLPDNIIKTQPVFETLIYRDIEYRVLYTGISKDSLYKRVIKIHLLGNNAGKSTLRKSLGCLWGYKFVPRDKNQLSQKTKYNDEDERKITLWMRKNLLFLSVGNYNPDSDEQELIDTFNPPLNLQNNNNLVNIEFRKQLSRLRAKKIGE